MKVVKLSKLKDKLAKPKGWYANVLFYSSIHQAIHSLRWMPTTPWPWALKWLGVYFPVTIKIKPRVLLGPGPAPRAKTSHVVLSEAVDWCICFTRKVQHGSGWEYSRPKVQNITINFLMTVPCGLWAEQRNVPRFCTESICGAWNLFYF